MSPDAVSVVIPCFNQAQFLNEAIDSALRQTCPPAEVLVVDDGSDDNTAAIVAGYPSVRYLLQTHRGLAAARNTGLRHVQGTYVLFLDADDRLLSRAVAVGMATLRERPECAFVS